MLVSCASIGNSSRYPVWIDDVPNTPGVIVFIGYGEGENQKEARDNAYEDALLKMGEGLGYDPRDFYLRELIAYERISDLGSSVYDYFEEEVDGVWRSWVRIDANEQMYIAARSEEYSALLEREARIAGILEESLEEYRTNRDVNAINKVFEAILVSLEGEVENESYTPEALVQKATEYVDNLKITTRNESKDSIGVTVRVSRTKGWFYPRVEDALILSTYTIMTSLQEESESAFVSKTNDKGEFYFYSTNPLVVREGAVEFSIVLDSTLIDSIDKIDDSLLKPLKAVLDSKNAVYSYQEKGNLDKRDTLIVLSQVDINGGAINDDTFIKTFVSFMEDAKIPGWSVIKDTSDDDEEELIEKLSARYPNIDNIIIARIGIVEFGESPNHVFARTEGYSLLYQRSKDGSLELVKNQQSMAVGVGDDLEAAQENGFINQARISASLLLEEL